MQARITALTLALLLGALPLYAATQTAQQQKMSTCNAQAKEKQLNGDDRKSFMKTCLSSTSTTQVATNSQQLRMKQCNAEAKSKNMAGDERKQFMNSCLRKH